MTGQQTLPEKPVPATVETANGICPSSVPPVSYNFRLFKPGANGLPHQGGERNSAGLPSTPPDPKTEALKRKVADALVAYKSRLQISQLPYEQIARFEKISVEETRRKYRQLELNSPEGGDGVQVVLSDEEASVTIPFWHEGPKAAATFEEVWGYLEIICKETGYSLYDPQIGRVLDPAQGRDEALARYHEIVGRIRGELPAIGPKDGSGWIPVRSTRLLVGADGRHFPEVQQLTTSADREVLVALGESGSLCGFAEVSIRHDGAGGPAHPVAHLDGWYVHPEFRGRGIGRRLLESAERWAAAHGLRELASDVKPDDERRIQAHLSCGFTETSRAVRFLKIIPSPSSSSREGG